MSQIIAFSGPQGAGKSSLLAMLAAYGWHVDDFKVSRAVQLKLGWKTLDQVLTSMEVMKKFQTRILEEKIKRDSELKANTEHIVILTERSFLDIVAYTRLWLFEFISAGVVKNINEELRWLSDFTSKCFSAQELIYKSTIFIPMHQHVSEHIASLPHDAHRAKQEHVQFFENELKVLIRWQAITNYTIEKLSVIERADEVHAILKNIKEAALS